MAKLKKEVTEGVETREVNQDVVVPKVEILRGRMPVVIVAMIRNLEAETATAAIAAKYRTTVGKVDDIKKGRNFGYVDGTFKPTEAQKADAIKYIEQLDESVVAGALEALDNMGLAEDGGASFEAARTAARKSKSKADKPAAEGDIVEEVVAEGEVDADLADLADLGDMD